MLGQGRRELDADLDAHDRGDADDERRARPAGCRTGPAASVPTAAVGKIASSEVAAASTWPRPRATSAGTKRIPPPTPKRPDITPAASPRHDREDDRGRAHPAISQMPTATRSTAKRDRQAPAREALLRRGPISAPAIAGMPTSSA